MPSLVVKIRMDNAAFSDGAGGGIEAARLLRAVAEWVDGDMPMVGWSRGIYDVNGNKVGAVVIRGRVNKGANNGER